VDRQAVYDLYSQIRQRDNWQGWGILYIRTIYEQAVAAVFQTLGGIALSVTLFVRMVPADSPLAFLNSPLSVLVMLALMLLISLASAACSGKRNSYYTHMQEDALYGNRLFNFWCNEIGGDRKRAPDLRMYNQMEKVGATYFGEDHSFDVHSRIAGEARGIMGFWAALAGAVSVVLTGAVYLFVCLKALGGAFGVGEVTQYVSAITGLFLGISQILHVLNLMQLNADSLTTCFEFLDIPHKMYKGSLTTEKRSDRQYEIEFKDVSFKYPGSDTWALRHVNLSFKVGSRLAVVGQNGSGKTTFIKLLCRLYDPTEGEIRLNGIDIRKYRYDEYIAVFSVVFQDFKLFSLPVGQNIAGKVDYDRERAEQCLKDAGYTGSFPKGMDTYLYKDIDKDGVDVSGGEAQKIAIARALYKDAPFIILDEPTAALDPIAEAEIYSKFDDIAGDRTAVYISHRLSSCKFCDEIAVFDGGQVVQKGSHESLLADTSGRYAELWNAQAQYYTEEEERRLL
ncbi:MAG TPA: ABC transporter ATP-binding protein, partial [Candidatus Faecivivens stercoravium]|nr:ABC transporter ATP-binding protein [Candidatus Faecivivens stercoravium]